MIRRALALLSLSLGAVACSGADPAPAAFSGTIAGRPFVAAEATAFVWEAPTTCANPEFSGWNMAMVEVRFASFAGACDLAVDTAFCGAKAGAREARIAVLRANVYGGPVPAIGPGTYTEEGTHVADANGVVRFLWLGIGELDAACAPLAAGMPKEAAGGSLTLDEVGPARVRGRAELRFDNGDVLSGAFDAPVCPSSDEAYCLAMKGGCTVEAFACVP